MDEWILVEFSELRDVLIDGTILGSTNTTFRVQLGTHTITLGGVQNYTPASITAQIFGTTQGNPKKFTFRVKP